MRFLFILLFSLIANFSFSQNLSRKCLAYIKVAYEWPQIQKKYDVKREKPVYEFKNGVYYKSNLPICVSEVLFNNDSNISAYRFVFKNNNYYGSPDSFKLKDSLQVIKKLKNLSADSLLYYKFQGEEIQKSNLESYYLEIKNRMIKKYGVKNGTLISKNKTWIGMTKKMLIDSQGEGYSVGASIEDSSGYTVEYKYEDDGLFTSYIIHNGKVISIIDY